MQLSQRKSILGLESVVFLVIGGLFALPSRARAEEDDYEFQQPGGYPLDVTTVRLAEGFPGLGAEPGKDPWLEPVDGAGGFDIVAPQLGTEDGPGGLEWDISPTYRTRYKGGTDYIAGSGMRVQGNNWFLRIPYAAFNYYGTTITVRFDANTLRVYDKDYTGVFWGRYSNKNSKIVVTGTSPYRTISLFDTGGKTYTFLETQSFKCTKIQGLGGAEVTITYNSGDITVLQKPSATSGSEVRKFVYTIASNRLDKIDVYEKNGANWDLYVKVDFTYFEDVIGAVEGTTGDLIGVKVERLLSPASTWLERRWRICYWTGTFNSSTNPGYPYQVRSVVGPQGVRDFEAANPGADIYTKTTSQLASYVDFTAEYEADKRVDKLDLKAGCGCGGAEGLYTFDWAVYAGTPSDLNSWAHQVLVTYSSANGGKLIVDYNKYHEVLNRVFQEVAGDTGSRRWITTFRHDTTGRLTDSYSVKACTLYTDLTHTVTTSLTAGMRHIFAYASNDSLSTVKLRDPANGNENYQQKTAFTLFVNGDRRRYVLDSRTVYPTETTTDTGGKTTSFSYTYHTADTLARKLQTTTLPVVSTSENGSGTAIVLKDYFELDGLHTWSKDGDGFVHYSGYDANRRTLTLQVRDLNTSSPPSGVPSPPDAVFNTSSGLNLTDAWEYDSQRRLTKHESPAFNAWDGTSIVSTKTTQRWWYTKLSGGESVVLHYPHVDSAYFHAALSISVSNHEGQTLTSALGELSSSYRDTTLSDDFDATQSTLAAAFHGTITRRQDNVYTGDKLTQEQVWSDADNGSADKFTTTHTYNSLGQHEKTTSPAGTITKSGFDVLGRQKWTKVGTVDGGAGDDMTLTEEVFYDDEENSSSNVGEGLVTRTKRYPNQASQVRQTDTAYDYRGRPIQIDEPLAVRRTETYDNLNRPLVSQSWDTTFPLSPELLAKSESFYDSVGEVYESREYEVPLATNKYLNTLTWRNARGLVVKTQIQGKQFQKTEYDGAGRTVNTVVSLDTDETLYGDTDDLTGDTVIDERRVVLDPTGAVELVRHYERKPNVSGEGPLTLTTARAQYSASWYDKLHRHTVAVSYGTNGGTDMTSRPTGSPPSTSDSSKLVTKSTHTPKSELETTTDPMGIVARLEYFDFGEVSKLIENYHTTPGSDPDDDRTTEYTFDSAGRHWKTTAKASGTDQVTENIWAVTKNTDNSTISSNDLFYKEKQPDTTEVDVLGYNALEEPVWKKDSHGTEHVYEYDERGRLIHDRATVLGTGIDGEVRRVSVTYDKLDRPLKVSSYDNATVGSGTVKNEVQFEYGPYSTVTKVYQEWGGAVNTSTSKKVQHAWSFPTSGATGVRRTSTTYPGGLVVDDVYNSGTDGTISDVLNRRSGADNQGSELYREQSFLGVARVLRRSFAGTAAVWTMDFGGGLDGQNRPADLYTQDASQVMLNRYQYAYNYNSQITSRLDLVGNVSGSYEFNEDFQYDELGRLLKHRRGKDLDTGSPVIRLHECWTLDRSGNKTAYYSGTASTCGTTWTATFNTSNEHATWSGGTVTYDQKGHMTEKGSYDYVYDAWGRMVKVVWGGWLETGIYKYNGLNQRIYAKDVNANETRYYFDLSRRVVEERKPSDDSLIRWYVFGDQYVDDLVVEGPTKRYHVQDILFNTVSRLDSNGVVDLRFVYDAYGTPKALSTDWTTWQTISREYSLFTDRGYRNDHAHYDFRNRYQDPELGVFVTRDLIGTWGDAGNWGNGYGYVGNDPVNNSDPSGLWSIPDHRAYTNANVDWMIAQAGRPAWWWRFDNGGVELMRGGFNAHNANQDLYRPYFRDLKRHYNRPITENASVDFCRMKEYDGSYRSYIRSEEQNLTNAASSGCSGDDCIPKCISGIEALGHLFHSWQDYYAHAADASYFAVRGDHYYYKWYVFGMHPVRVRSPRVSWNSPVANPDQESLYNVVPSNSPETILGFFILENEHGFFHVGGTLRAYRERAYREWSEYKLSRLSTDIRMLFDICLDLPPRGRDTVRESFPGKQRRQVEFVRPWCFVAGTVVKTAHGDKSIEEIQPGMWVDGMDIDSGSIVSALVLSVHTNVSEEIVTVEVDEERIKVTPMHPFFVNHRGWVRAGELRMGDQLVSADGGLHVVAGVTSECSSVPVFNLTVDTVHTYFVGGCGVLVHNKI